MLKDVAHQIREGNTSIIGVMIESFIEAGNQPILADRSQMLYGCTVTDACINWPTTERLLTEMRELLKAPLYARHESQSKA